MRPIIFFLFFIPLSLFASEEILQKKFYTLSYNEDHEVANWVSYELNHERLRNCAKRRNNFRSDPDVSTGSADLEDYRGSGYDRGHMVPAGDMKFSAVAMDETFFLSNMAPQPPRFNQGIWAKLEDLMRAWALKYKSIYLVTGPILKPNLPFTGGPNQVSIPEAYFKLIVRKEGSKIYGIAFLLDTRASSHLSSYTLSIDEVEDLTGIDFFKEFSDREQMNFESTKNDNDWDFSAKSAYLPCRT